MLHVSRDTAGRRRLSEIAVLDRDTSGVVHARTVWHVDRMPASSEVARLIEATGAM